MSEEKKARGIEMDSNEIEEFLYEQGHGTLSLTNEGETYGVPISFGYDGEDIYMNLIRFGEQSKKIDYKSSTDQVSLTTYNAKTKYEWKSVIITGIIEKVSEDESEYVEEVLDDNAWFPTLYPPTSPMADVERVRLRITDATGRKGQHYQN